MPTNKEKSYVTLDLASSGPSLDGDGYSLDMLLLAACVVCTDQTTQPAGNVGGGGGGGM